MKILITGGSGFIGTNYMEFLINKNEDEFINVDFRSPRNKEHNKYWKECDILDKSKLKKIIDDFGPTHVVHLAAKTGLNEKKLSDFAANMEGVENLLLALREVRSVERVIFTSSLLVCRMGYIPKHDTDYQPTTLYGQSKVRGEQIVRAAENLPYTWTIIRPISIWGPWGEEPYKNFFKAIAQGWYFHIGSGHYRRSMGYVENMTHQVHQILLAPAEKVNKETFYLGDSPPVDLCAFADEIQKALGARKIHHMPLRVAKSAAKCGDILKNLGWKSVPLTSFRLNNILTEYIFNLQSIMEISGLPLYDFKTGIRRTIQWMRQVGEI